MFLTILSASAFYKILKISPFSILHIILMLCQYVNTQYVLVAAEPLKQIIQIFAIQRLHQRQAKGARLFATAKIVTLLTVRWMNLLADYLPLI